MTFSFDFLKDVTENLLPYIHLNYPLRLNGGSYILGPLNNAISIAS